MLLVGWPCSSHRDQGAADRPERREPGRRAHARALASHDEVETSTTCSPSSWARRHGRGQGEDAARPADRALSTRSTASSAAFERRSRRCAGCSSSPTSATERAGPCDAEQVALAARLRGSGFLNCVRSSAHAARVETEARCALAKRCAMQLRPDAFAAHPRAEARVVVLAAAHLADARHHARGALREVLLEPLAGTAGSPPRAGAARCRMRRVAPAAGGGLEDALDLGLVDERDDRRDAHADRHAGVAPASRSCAGADAARRRAARGCGRASASSEVTET